MTQYGRVLSANIEIDGSELASAHSVGATVLDLEDALIFIEPDPGEVIQVRIISADGATEELATIAVPASDDDDDATIDDDDGFIELAAPLANAFSEGDRVEIYQRTQRLVAHVMLEDDPSGATMVDAIVHHTLYTHIPEGDVLDIAVQLEHDGEDYHVVDIIGQQPIIDGSFTDPETIPPPSPPADKIPNPPENLSVVARLLPLPDGTFLHFLDLSWTHPGTYTDGTAIAGTLRFLIEIVTVDEPIRQIIEGNSTSLLVPGNQALTVNVYALDYRGAQSAAATAAGTADPDDGDPAVPVGLALEGAAGGGGVGVIYARWDRNSESDMSHYEVHATRGTEDTPATTDQDSAQAFPGTVVSEAPGDVAWTNPANATTDNATDATCVLAPGQTSQVLRGHTLGFSIPAGAEIDGIEVEIEHSSNHGASVAPQDAVARLTVAGVAVGSNKAQGDWPGTMSTRTYGGPTDKWGREWTVAELVATGFGFLLQVANAEGDFTTTVTLSVDYIARITVYWTLVIASIPGDPPQALTASTVVGVTDANTFPVTQAWRDGSLGPIGYTVDVDISVLAVDRSGNKSALATPMTGNAAQVASDDVADLESDDYAFGVAGWRITKSGNVEFNNGTFRGSLVAARIVSMDSDGGGIVIDGSLDQIALGSGLLLSGSGLGAIHFGSDCTIFGSGAGAISVGSGIVISGVGSGRISMGTGLEIDGAGAGTITGGTIRTAAAGRRVQLEDTNGHELEFLNDSSVMGRISLEVSNEILIRTAQKLLLVAGVPLVTPADIQLGDVLFNTRAVIVSALNGLQIGTQANVSDNHIRLRAVDSNSQIPDPPAGYAAIFYNNSAGVNNIVAKNSVGVVRALGNAPF